MPFGIERVRLWILPCLLVLLASCSPSTDRTEQSGRDDESQSAGVASRNEPVRTVILLDSWNTSLRMYQAGWLEKFVRSRPGVELVVLDAAGDEELQVRQLDYATTEKVKFAFVFPIKSEAVIDAMRRLKSQGAFVMAFDKGIPEEACSSAIFADDKAIGQLAGRHVVDALNKKAHAEGFTAVLGRVVELRGNDDASGVSADTASGFAEALKTSPGITLVHDAPAHWNANEALDRTREAVRLQKRFDVVFAHDDVMAAGADRAMKETPMRDATLIIGVGGMFGPDGGMKQVQDGVLDASVFYPPLVDVAWKQMKRLLDDPSSVGAIPKRTLVKPFVIDYSKAVGIAGKGLPKPEISTGD